MRSFFKEINKSNPFEIFDDKDDDEEDASVINCKYVDLNTFNYKPKENMFSLFHTNIGSLAKHKEELETILKMLDFKFDIIGITETKLCKHIQPKFDIQLKGYKCYHVDTWPTEMIRPDSLLQTFSVEVLPLQCRVYKIVRT